MKPTIKNSIAIVGMILLAFLLLSIPKESKVENKEAESWKKYSSQGIGIEFEIPNSLHPFPLREVNFSESENDPSSIDVSTEFVGTKTVKEAMRDLKPKPVYEKIIAQKIIDGSEAIITVSTHEDSDQQQKTMYIVRGNLLYTISSRWIDEEKFWNSIKFLQEDF